MKAARSTARPIDVFVARLEGVRGKPPKLRARCPAHGSRGQSLSIREADDGTVIAKCFAGCSCADIVHAVGLDLQHLFPQHTAAAQRDQRELDTLELQAYRREPAGYLRAALRRAINSIQEQRERELGYYAPLRSREVDRARQRVATTIGLNLCCMPAAIGWPLNPRDYTTRQAIWEWPDFDDDPTWPRMFMTSLEREFHYLVQADPTFDLDSVVDPWRSIPHTMMRAGKRTRARIRQADRIARAHGIKL